MERKRLNVAREIIYTIYVPVAGDLYVAGKVIVTERRRSKQTNGVRPRGINATGAFERRLPEVPRSPSKPGDRGPMCLCG